MAIDPMMRAALGNVGCWWPSLCVIVTIVGGSIYLVLNAL
jgi:hypothetical protein